MVLVSQKSPSEDMSHHNSHHTVIQHPHMAGRIAVAAIGATTSSDGAGLELMENNNEPPLPIDMVVALLDAAKSTKEQQPNKNSSTL